MAAPGAFGLLDDAACVSVPDGHDLVVSKDMLVADRHFFSHDPPALIAAKALRVNLSDLAAKGAVPLGFLLGLALAEDWQVDWLEAFSRGLAADAARYDIPLLGGDTVKAHGGTTLSVTVLGSVPKGRMVRRTTARAGDRLYVTGTIGDAALGLRLLQKPLPDWAIALDDAQRHTLIDRYHLPQPRNALAMAVQSHASAGMDISDGFVGDLSKLLSKAKLSARVKLDEIPLSSAARMAIAADPSLIEVALTGGDDYEIIIAVSPGEAEPFERLAGECGVTLACLGSTTGAGAQPLEIVDGEGRALSFNAQSFAHF
ncbi:MAG: thiamine-phosphate kinase [Beijerinckiaceae bacterium]|nr:thiamine-phosphate kinase [Beijerinckiaceae bacterium]